MGAWEDAALSDGSPAGLADGRVRGRIYVLSALASFLPLAARSSLLLHHDASVGAIDFVSYGFTLLCKL